MLRLKEQLQDYPAYRDSYINECLHLPKDQKLARVRKYNKLDDDYCYGPSDRKALDK